MGDGSGVCLLGSDGKKESEGQWDPQRVATGGSVAGTGKPGAVGAHSLAPGVGEGKGVMCELRPGSHGGGGGAEGEKVEGVCGWDSVTLRLGGGMYVYNNHSHFLSFVL